MNIDWTLMAKVFAGEASQEEVNDFNKWSLSDQENKKLTDMLKKNWDSVKVKVDVDKAWINLHHRFEEEQLIPVENNRTGRIHGMYALMRVAASIVLLVGLGIISYLLFNPAERNIHMTARTLDLQEFDISLPDGSKVDLNAGSKLEYQLLRSGIRKVNLEGEAFFDIAHDEFHTFVINAGEGVIQVTGTSFSVRTVPGKDRIEVYVESGNVQFYRTRKQDRTLSLKPGQMGVLEQNQLSENTDIEPNHLSWKTRKLSFRETRLADVAGVLNRTYSQNIRFTDKALEDCLFTGTFDKQPVDSVVRVIQIAFGLDVARDGKTYVLSGDGCN